MAQYLILISLFLLITNCNEDYKPEVKEKKVIAFIENEIQTQGIPGLQVAIIKNNKIVMSKAFGLANVALLEKTDEKTNFSINSISKIFTSTAILQLEEQNKLNISDKISEHINNLPRSWRDVTIEQLLSHTSGIPDIEDPINEGLYGGKGQDSSWIMTKKMPNQFPIGDKFSYNATNYFLIKKIIDKYSHVSYEEFLQQNQFDRAGINKIYFENSLENIGKKSPTYCYYYQDKTTKKYVKGDSLLEVKDEFYCDLQNDKGAFSTAKNLANWIIALQTGKLLSNKENIYKMWKPVKLKNDALGGFDEFLNAYAFGWPISVTQKEFSLLAIGGGRASLKIYPKDDLTVIVLTNLTGIYSHEIADNISRFYVKD